MKEVCTIELTFDDLLNTLQPKGLPDPILYQYYRCLLKRKIIINEEIGDGLLETAIIPFMEMDNDGSGMPIELIILTVGGALYSGFNIIDMIEIFDIVQT